MAAAVRHLTAPERTRSIDIAPGDANHEIRGEATLASDAKLVWVHPHQHYRGRYFEMHGLSDGERNMVCAVPIPVRLAVDTSRRPLDLPKVTRIETGRYDNSPRNSTPIPLRAVDLAA